MKKRKNYIWLGILFLLVIICGLGYWKRIGIRNTIYRMLDIPIPVEKAEEEVYGYYKTAVDVDAGIEDNLAFVTNDEKGASVSGSMASEASLVEQTASIDEQITAEVASGNYSFAEPLVILNPYQISPLTGVIVFQTEKACRVRVTVKGKTEAADISGETAETTEHRVPLVGLYPDSENCVLLELLDENGETLEETELTVKTEGLPDVFTDMVVPQKTSGESAYGMTIVSGQDVHYPFAYDVNGDIRWYLSRQTASYGVFGLSNSRLVFQDKYGYVPSVTKSYSTIFYEMDYLGRTYEMYFVPQGTHHEIKEKEPGGNFLVLTNTMEDHIEDKIVEIDRQTGEIVNSLKLIDVLGTGLESYIDEKIDWAHLNTVSYNAKDDTILISPRNLHSGIKINWTTHELVWILGNPEFWEGTGYEEYVLQPTEDFMWHYQQHTVYEVEEDLDNDPDTIQISVFDNHVHGQSKVSFYEKTADSYATVYAVNEKEKTVSLLKQVPVVRSTVTSNTTYDADSGRLFAMCGSLKGEEGAKKGMTYEFDYETEEIINQFYINAKFYRAIEMTMDYEDLSLPMEIDDDYVKGNLRPAVYTEKEVPEPEAKLETGLTFKLTSQILFMEMKNHHVSQVIFKGEQGSYVYDLSFLKQYSEDYLQHTENIPVPLMEMEPGTYQIYCMYMDEYYDTGEEFEILK